MVRFLLLLVAITSSSGHASFAFYTWNMKHLGRTSQNLTRVAEILGGGTELADKHKLPPADLIVLQEVNTTFSGLDKLRKLRKEITARIEATTEKKSGTDFFLCSAVSPTPTDGIERYAMIWNEKKLHRVSEKAEEIACGETGDSPEKLELTTHLNDKITREPAFAWFRDYSSKGQKKFRAFTMHAVPKAKHPEDEMPLVFQAIDYHTKADERVVVAGDFNLESTHQAFEEAKKSFSVIFNDDPATSLKQSKKQLNEPYDNILVKNIKFDRRHKTHKVINLYEVFDLAPSTTYSQLSDHCPLAAQINLDE